MLLLLSHEKIHSVKEKEHLDMENSQLSSLSGGLQRRVCSTDLRKDKPYKLTFHILYIENYTDSCI